MPPAARITDFHACPMVTPGTPPIPHVGGPIIKGSHNVLTGKLPQARVGDMAVCVGPPDTIVKGSSGVFVNKMPAARIGDSTAHGGTIVAGLPTVIIGESKSISGGGAAVPKGALMLAYSDFVAQLKVLIDAQRTGAPFCEACFKAAQEEAAASLMANAAAPSPAKDPAQSKPKAPATPASAPKQIPARPVSPECAKLADARDQAMLASDAYNPGKAVPAGYQHIDPKSEAGRRELAGLGVDPSALEPRDSDFRASIYKHGNDYVVSYRGTQTGADWIQNAKQGLGFESDHYNRAKLLAKDVQIGAGAQGGNVRFTGHSLGGGMASAAALSTNRRATTFNSAGLHAHTVASSSAKPPVDAYYVPGEALSGLQDNRGAILSGLTGALTAVSPFLGAAAAGWLLGSQAGGAPTLPVAYGQRHRLPDAAPPGKSWTDQHNPVDKHGMDWVLHGIDTERAQKGCP